MKKFFAFLTIAITMFFAVSCGSDNDDSGNTGNDSANTGDDSGNTGNDISNTGDDTSNTGTDSDVTDTGNDTDTSDTAVECVGISFDTLELQDGYSSYRGSPLSQIGDETLEDYIVLGFFNADTTVATSLTAGTYDLGKDNNTNYSTCTECLLVYEDWDGSAINKTYFQESGTLTITEVKENTLESKGTVSAKLVEVTIADDDYTSTPVEGGGCYEIETGTWNNICIANCEGKICGDDGCGGTCGDGCTGDTTCNADGTACVAYECTAITLGTIETDDISDTYWTYKSAYTPNTGDATIDDEFSVQLFSSAAAGDSFDLANTNYIDCNQCLLVYEDTEYDTAGTLTSIGKIYFQQKGTMSFESFDSATGKIKATVENVRLVEVTIADDYTSTPVQSGTCLEIANGTIEIQ